MVTMSSYAARAKELFPARLLATPNTRASVAFGRDPPGPGFYCLVVSVVSTSGVAG